MKVQPKNTNKFIVIFVGFLVTTGKQFQVFTHQIIDLSLTFFCLTLNRFIITMNPKWIQQFTENELRILDKWIATRNLQLNLLLIYLALPFTHFDEDSFITSLSYSQRATAFLNLLFAFLFGFLSLILTLTALYRQTPKAFWILVGLAFICGGTALGLIITQVDKYAAIIIQRINAK